MTDVGIILLVEEFELGSILLVDGTMHNGEVCLPQYWFHDVDIDEMERNMEKLCDLSSDMLNMFAIEIEDDKDWSYIGKIIYENCAYLVLHRFAKLMANINRYEADGIRLSVSPSIYDETFNCFSNPRIKDPILLYKQYLEKVSQ